MHLILAGIANADDRFLDQPRGIFANLYARFRSIEQANAPRLSQLQRRLRIGVDEHFLHRRRTWAILKNKIGQRRIKRQQARGQSRLGVGLDLAVGDMAQPIAIDGDQPPAGCAKAGVKTKQDQPSFSITSSETS